MVDIIDQKVRDLEKRTQDFKRIILCHTSRNIDEYLTSLKYRHNKGYKKIPHFIVTRGGNILQTLSLEQNSKFFNNEDFDKGSLIICLENLGWLEKKPLQTEYLNWIGNIYKGEVYNKSWRDYNIWQPYTDIQIKKLSELCLDLIKNYNIKNECIGTNTKMKSVELFKGIITRSNFDNNLTDLSPAFSFETFIKYLENE